MRLYKLCFICSVFGLAAVVSSAQAEIASKGYVDAAVSSQQTTDNMTTTVSSTSTDAEYPSARATYEFSSDAANLTTGQVGYARLPVGTVANKVAAGDDSRFDTVPTDAPSGTPATGRAFIWFN
ncbi:MAG: hypothetical protein IJ560_04490 [Alphaproteobacteria bacterium]|nr:hypothetical protein [Alphaproteobacteria bacterium]